MATDRPAPFWANISELLEDRGDGSGWGFTRSDDLPGVDASSFQGRPADWMPVAGRIDWAGVKFTELQPNGLHYVNPYAAADWAALKAAGKFRLAYLFGHPSTDPAAAVALFLAEVRAAGLEDGDGVCLDHETTDGRSPAEVAAWGVAVLSAPWHQAERMPVVYTFLDFAQEGNCARMGGYPLWIADPSSPAGHPRIPAPWSVWSMHQYAITGQIDRDVAGFADVAQMRAALGKRRPAPSPPPVAAALTKDSVMPQLLPQGPGPFPLSIPEGTKALRFVTDQETNAEVRVEFHAHTATDLNLTWPTGSHRLPVPDGCHAALVFRADSGAGLVSVAVE